MLLTWVDNALLVLNVCLQKHIKTNKRLYKTYTNIYKTNKQLHNTYKQLYETYQQLHNTYNI